MLSIPLYALLGGFALHCFAVRGSAPRSLNDLYQTLRHYARVFAKNPQQALTVLCGMWLSVMLVLYISNIPIVLLTHTTS